MLRTTAPGFAPGNLYSEGNPSLSIPATVVSAEAANFWQEEIVNTVLQAGLTLGAAQTQLRDAILVLAGQGGSQITPFSIANNQVAAANVTGLVIDSVVTKAAIISYAIDRQDATPRKESQVGQLHVIYDNVAAAWLINDTSVLENAEVVFSINTSGQVLYTSSNFTGGSYVGTLRATILKIKV